MIRLEPRSLAILRLALCPGAADGEWRNAAAAFFNILRRDGVTPERFLDAARTASPPPRVWPTLPFGRYRGVPLDRVPVSYLTWALANCTNLSIHLRAAIADCLQESAP
jgi:hypothetical protein